MDQPLFRSTRLRTTAIAFLLTLLWSAAAGATSSKDSAAVLNTDVAQKPAVLPEITVVAPRPPTPKEVAGDSVPRFINAHSRAAVVTGQLARWRDRICPAAFGLSPAFNEFVAQRILAIAARVGAPHETADHCKPNALIFFTAEPQKQMAELVKWDSKALGFHYPRQTQRLTFVTHPIQGWYVTATRADDGSTQVDLANPLDASTSAPASVGMGGSLLNSPTPAGKGGSRLTTGRNSLLVTVLIVADTKTVAGRTIGSVSDYLAMLVLSQANLQTQCSPLPSILDMLSTECASQEKPDAVTFGDVAFLRALYSTDLRESLDLEQSDILNNMRKQFGAFPTVADADSR